MRKEKSFACFRKICGAAFSITKGSAGKNSADETGCWLRPLSTSASERETALSFHAAEAGRGKSFLVFTKNSWNRDGAGAPLATGISNDRFPFSAMHNSWQTTHLRDAPIVAAPLGSCRAACTGVI